MRMPSLQTLQALDFIQALKGRGKADPSSVKSVNVIVIFGRHDQSTSRSESLDSRRFCTLSRVSEAKLPQDLSHVHATEELDVFTHQLS